MPGAGKHPGSQDSLQQYPASANKLICGETKRDMDIPRLCRGGCGQPLDGSADGPQGGGGEERQKDCFSNIGGAGLQLNSINPVIKQHMTDIAAQAQRHDHSTDMD